MSLDLQKPTFLSIPEAAKFCGATRTAFYLWVRQGKVSTYKTPGGKNLIRPTDLVDFMSGCGMFVSKGLAELARQDAELV
ncbi:MAG: helix-turn-helix domain-containing protein [Kiritimatiellae bacterium]|nr:helix-turn-helix domain-containing protein [Kiritimatiellia bacterium]